MPHQARFSWSSSSQSSRSGSTASSLTANDTMSSSSIAPVGRWTFKPALAELDVGPDV